MSTMWAGRFTSALDTKADDFNSSISFDSRMFRQDITGSMAHAAMLGQQGIVTAQEADQMIAALEQILKDIESGVLEIDQSCEDVHMFAEQVLTQRLGDLGKKLHTARSRNDQVAVDLRMYLRQETETIQELLTQLLRVIADKAEEGREMIMPGYTHLQRAQPIVFGHHMMAYAGMFLRDRERLEDAKRRMNVSPLGSCALAGTTYPTDRFATAKALGFDAPCPNSLDGVSDRDFCIELLSAFSTVMMHLSRFCEEIILWSSWEFKFIELADAFTTGSSIMPQKKNPDMAELIRGKTGRVYGHLMGTLTMLKGLPLAYNKDMQEDKEAIFDSVDTVKHCLEVFTPMLQTTTLLADNMLKAVQKGFINATDLADYLVNKGLPFRSAYKTVGQLVGLCVSKNTTLDQLPLEEYRQHSSLFDQDLYQHIDPMVCVTKRTSYGGTSPESVARQIAQLREQL